MSTELTALMNQSVSTPVTADLNALKSSTFIPSLSIGYGTSKMVMEGKASVGEFTFGGQTALGKKIDVVVVDWRLHAAFVKKEAGNINGEAWHWPKSGDSANDPEYQSFLSSTPPEDHELKEGADVLLWLPSQTMFGLFFMKGTLAKCAPVLVQTGSGFRVVEISTAFKEWPEKKRKWFEIDSRAKAECCVNSPLEAQGVKATTSIPDDLFEKYFKIWLNPVKGATVEEESVERDR